MAYALGVSRSAVSMNRKTAMRKLGLRTHADVVRLFAPPAPAQSTDER
jgi:DNA-binding CsgD family transcriptional regulator